MDNLRQLTLDDLRALEPCYEPSTRLGVNWTGNVLTILNHDDISDSDKIWAVTRLVDDKTARLFAVYCAREVLKYIPENDREVFIVACDTAEKYANGLASTAELEAASASAYASYASANAVAGAASASACASACASAYASSSASAASSSANAAYASAVNATYAAYASPAPTVPAAYKKFVEHLRNMLKEVSISTNPKDLVGSKKLSLHLVPPASKAYQAAAMEDGARKYGPYNWRDNKVQLSIYVSAVFRHMEAYWDGENDAKDSGLPHLAHAIADLGIIIDAKEAGNLIDDRPKPGTMPQLLERFQKSKK